LKAAKASLFDSKNNVQVINNNKSIVISTKTQFLKDQINPCGAAQGVLKWKPHFSAYKNV